MSCAFRPDQTVKLVVSNSSSAAVAIAGIGRNIRIANFGDHDAYVNLTQTFASATSSNMVILARTVEVFDRGCNGVVAALGRNGTTDLDITTGEGC